MPNRTLRLSMFDENSPDKHMPAIKHSDEVKEHETIKNVNYQNMLSMLKEQGIDGTKIPRMEFDKLLRIKDESALKQSIIKLKK